MTRLRRVAGIAALLTTNCAFVPTAGARDKTDVIVMNNGDRITGEIKRLENGVLQVDLDYVDGTLSIDWLKVARLESTARFLVQLQDGSVFSASIVTREALAGTPVKIEIRPLGQEPREVDSTRVVTMTQTSASVWQRLSGSISLGATYTKGNSTTQYNIGSDIEYLESRWGARALYTSNLSSSTGATASTRNQLDTIAYRRLPWNNYFYAGTAGFLQSSVQGIQREVSLGLGVGRFFKHTNRMRFSALGGLGWQTATYTVPVTNSTVQNTAVALMTSNLQVFTFKKTQLSIDGSVAPALKPEIGRVFSKVNATYYLKLFGKVDWNFSFYGNWDTRPPANLPSSDYGSSTGLSYTFGNR